MKRLIQNLLLLIILIMGSWLSVSAELIPAEQSPLGSRVPLILIHGIRPARGKEYDWKPFLTYAEANPEFKSRYKPYLFIYPPSELIDNNSQTLRTELKQYRALHPQAPHFYFITQSLGGIVLRDALNDPELWQDTDRVIALGTAFHGSPLTNSYWMRARLRQARIISKLRRLNRISYWIFGFLFPHYKEDLCWDNFDGLMPEQYLKRHHCEPRVSTHSAEEEVQKYVVYAGFFGETAKERQVLRDLLGVPRNVEVKKFTPPMSRHLITYMIRPDLAYIPLNTDKTGSPHSLMWYNDGVSPIASQLWLGRFLQNVPRPISPETELQTLRALKSIQDVRLFEGLDHGDWLKGTTRYRNADRKLLDWLHPEQPPKDVFTWMLVDLMR